MAARRSFWLLLLPAWLDGWPGAAAQAAILFLQAACWSPYVPYIAELTR